MDRHLAFANRLPAAALLLAGMGVLFGAAVWAQAPPGAVYKRNIDPLAWRPKVTPASSGGRCVPAGPGWNLYRQIGNTCYWLEPNKMPPGRWVVLPARETPRYGKCVANPFDSNSVVCDLTAGRAEPAGAPSGPSDECATLRRQEEFFKRHGRDRGVSEQLARVEQELAEKCGSCKASFTDATGHSVSVLRVGISTAHSPRRVSLTAEMTPAVLSSSVTVIAGPGLEVRTARSAGSLQLSITGETATDEVSKNYSWVRIGNGTTPCGSQKIAVVVPRYVGIPLDTGAAAAVQTVNTLLTKGSSPSGSPTMSDGAAFLCRWYGKWLRVVVEDQFREPLGGLYEGAPIEEMFGSRLSPINRRLQADSSYLDPAGMCVYPKFATKAVGGKATLVEFPITSSDAACWQDPSCASKRWPAQWQPALSGTRPDINTFTIVVDGFKLTPPVQRTIIPMPPGNILIKAGFAP